MEKYSVGSESNLSNYSHKFILQMGQGNLPKSQVLKRTSEVDLEGKFSSRLSKILKFLYLLTMFNIYLRLQK